MSKLEAIEADIRALPRDKAQKLQDWLSAYLEDQAELNPEFIKSIERGKAVKTKKRDPSRSRAFL